MSYDHKPSDMVASMLGSHLRKQIPIYGTDRVGAEKGNILLVKGLTVFMAEGDRIRSRELDFGSFWTLKGYPKSQRFQVTWIQSTGEFIVTNRDRDEYALFGVAKTEEEAVEKMGGYGAAIDREMPLETFLGNHNPKMEIPTHNTHPPRTRVERLRAETYPVPLRLSTVSPSLQTLQEIFAALPLETMETVWDGIIYLEGSWGFIQEYVDDPEIKEKLMASPKFYTMLKAWIEYETEKGKKKYPGVSLPRMNETVFRDFHTWFQDIIEEARKKKSSDAPREKCPECGETYQRRVVDETGEYCPLCKTMLIHPRPQSDLYSVNPEALKEAREGVFRRNPGTITELYIQLYEAIKREYAEKGKPLVQYKPMERDKLYRFFETFADIEMPVRDIVIRLLDALVRMQALPNANHRTTMYFIHYLLKFNGMQLTVFPMDSTEWWKTFNEFVTRSRKCLHESDDPMLYGQSWYDKDCHFKAVDGWVTEYTQSAKWSMISSVRMLCRSWSNQSGSLTGSSGSSMGKDMDLQDIKPLRPDLSRKPLGFKQEEEAATEMRLRARQPLEETEDEPAQEDINQI